MKFQDDPHILDDPFCSCNQLAIQWLLDLRLRKGPIKSLPLVVSSSHLQEVSSGWYCWLVCLSVSRTFPGKRLQGFF